MAIQLINVKTMTEMPIPASIFPREDDQTNCPQLEKVDLLLNFMFSLVVVLF